MLMMMVMMREEGKGREIVRCRLVCDVIGDGMGMGV